MDRDVFLAILAMDSYHRGYGDGLPGLDKEAATLGEATIDDDDPNESNSYFAQEYTWDGETIISYRGTDNPAQDLWFGWLTGAGVVFPGSQLEDAIDFYHDVTSTSGLFGAFKANTTLVGHSLGGGLAGIIASLSGTNAVVFDHMPYGPAASALAFIATEPLPTADPVDAYYVSGEVLMPLRPAAVAAAAVIYEGLGPVAVAAIAGNAAAIELTQDITAIESHGGLRNPIDLHDPGLMALLLYADKAALTDWHPAGNALLDALFDRDANIALGLNPAKNYELVRILAYSAIDVGERPYGDSGIRALFNDANELGANWMVSDSLRALEEEIADVFVQFAGHLAINDVEIDTGDMNTDDDILLEGVIDDSDEDLFVINFADALWAAANDDEKPDVIVGRDTIVDRVMAGIGKDAVDDAMNLLWGSSDTNLIDKVVVTKSDASVNDKTLDERVGPADITLPGGVEPVTIFVAGGGDDEITGSSDHEIIWGAWGSDTLAGGDGSDILSGALGLDILRGDDDEEMDWLVGGLNGDFFWAGDLDIVGDPTVGDRLMIDEEEIIGVAVRAKGSSDPFLDDDGNTYVLDGADLKITLVSSSSEIVVKNFKNKDLGIELKEEEPDPPPGPDRGPMDDGGGLASPLVLDLDDDGLDLIPLIDSNVYFAVDGSELARLTSWITPDDGFLAIDRNLNGVIDNSSELFGYNTTVLRYDPARTVLEGDSGFSHLALLDDNLNGIIDIGDTAFGDLIVWRDLDSNGQSDATEFFGLTELGIATIALTATSSNVLQDGSLISDIGSFTEFQSDIVTFTDIDSDEVTYLRTGDNLDDLVISVDGSSDTLTIRHFFSGVSLDWWSAEEPLYYGIDELHFADSVIVLRETLYGMETPVDAAGDNIIYGSHAGAELAGGLGDDEVSGGIGDDRFFIDLGDGSDLMRDLGGDDALAFGEGITLTNLSLSRPLDEEGLPSYDLVMQVDGPEGITVTLENQLSGDPSSIIERFEFADGTSIDWLGLQTRLLESMATFGDDAIQAFDTDDVIDGKAGNDRLDGWLGDDRLIGGAGDDTFVYIEGNDVIEDFQVDDDDDVIEFSIDYFATFDDILAAGTEVGADVLITIDDENSVLIKNATLASLDQSDFMLV